MDYNTKYSEIINSLESGNRYLNKLNDEEILWLVSNITHKQDAETLEKLLCVIVNTQTETTKFASAILEILNSNQPADIIVYALNASVKHIISAKAKQGHDSGVQFIGHIHSINIKDAKLMEN